MRAWRMRMRRGPRTNNLRMHESPGFVKMEPFDLQIAPEELLPLTFNPAGIYPLSHPKYLRGTAEIPVSELYKINPSVEKIVKDTPGCDELIRSINIRLWICMISFVLGAAGWFLSAPLGEVVQRLNLGPAYIMLASPLLLVVSQIVFRFAKIPMRQLADTYNAHLADELARRGIDLSKLIAAPAGAENMKLQFSAGPLFPYSSPRFRYGAKEFIADEFNMIETPLREIVRTRPGCDELVRNINALLLGCQLAFVVSGICLIASPIGFIALRQQENPGAFVQALPFAFLPALFLMAISFLLMRDAKKIMAVLADTYNATNPPTDLLKLEGE